jgi:hypothetical protein
MVNIIDHEIGASSMVAGRHNLTRRALLGAAVGACAVPAAVRGQVARRLLDSDVGLLPFGLSLSKPSTSSDPAAQKERTALRQAQGERGGGGAALRRWTRALAAYRRAEARLAALRAEEALLPAAARAYPACEPLEERFNDLECVRLASLRRLLRAPAPDLAALARKIALTVDDQAWELAGAQSCLAVLKADARRLARAGNPSCDEFTWTV